MSKPFPLWGPCPTCGMPFRSRYEKKFCSMSCYTSSSEFLERIRSQAKRACDASVRAQGIEPTNGETVVCLECGEEMWNRPSQIGKRKFCSKTCYRIFMVKRFDRFIANPERIALPQNYDEFLTGQILNCLVDGCDWKGHRLSMHMNLFHGIAKREFKKAAGFNLKSGIVSAPEREALVKTALNFPIRGAGLLPGKGGARPKDGYRSREGAEHWNKSRAIAEITAERPKRICRGCGKRFIQSGVFGKAIYCGVSCRDESYAKQVRQRTKELSCDVCGSEFKGTSVQERRQSRGLPITCSMECRQRRAGRIARGTWVELEKA